MGYFSELDLMRGAPCLLDEIAALRGEENEMHPYDQMLANEWEQRVAEEDGPLSMEEELRAIIDEMGFAGANVACIDGWTVLEWCARLTLAADRLAKDDDEDLNDEKAQERRWRAE